MDLCGRAPWDKALEGRGAHKIWLILKDHLLQAQKQHIPKKQEVRQKLLEAHVGEKGSSGQAQDTKRKPKEDEGKDR